MYFDDATMQDWESEAFHSQACVADLMQLLGSPWAPTKFQFSSKEADLLGLMHDVSHAEEGSASGPGKLSWSRSSTSSASPKKLGSPQE